MKLTRIESSSPAFGAIVHRNDVLRKYTNNVLYNNMMHSRSIKRVFDNFMDFFDKYGTDKNIIRFDNIENVVLNGRKAVKASGFVDEQPFAFIFSQNSLMRKIKIFFNQKFIEMGILQKQEKPTPPIKGFKTAA